jgi:hypothetical protein
MYFLLWRSSLYWARFTTILRLYDHTQTTRVDRTPLDKWSARRTDLHLTIHSTYKRHINALAGFEVTLRANDRPQTHAFDRTAAGIGRICSTYCFCTATIVARTCLSVMLYVYWLSCVTWNYQIMKAIKIFNSKSILDIILTPWSRVLLEKLTSCRS